MLNFKKSPIVKGAIIFGVIAIVGYFALGFIVSPDTGKGFAFMVIPIVALIAYVQHRYPSKE